MAMRSTTARPAAPPTTPPAMVPAGGVLLLPLPPPLWVDALLVLEVALEVALLPACPAPPTI